MTVGPIQLIAITFKDFEPQGNILAELLKLNKSGVIRLIDLQFVQKDASGKISTMEMSGLSEAEQVTYGSVISGLMGMSAEDAPGNLDNVITAVEHSYGVGIKDFLAMADRIKPDSAAAILLIEHAWANRFSDLIQKAGGRMSAQGFLTREAMGMVGKEIEAQVEAVTAVETALAIQEKAIYKAAQAVALSDMIQEEAAARAVDALVAAELIEEDAIDHALKVMLAAELVEEVAIAEAQTVVAAAEEVKMQAVLEAVSALIASEVIQQEAAEQAVDALIASALIQEGARLEAMETIALAAAIEDAAMDEAAEAVATTVAIEDALADEE